MSDPDWQKLLDSQAADARTFAGRLSDAAKYVWLGSFGLLYAAMIAEKGALARLYAHDRIALLAAAGLGAVAFIADLGKNFVGLLWAAELGGWIKNNFKTGDFDAYNAYVGTSRKPRLNRACLFVSVTTAGLAAIIVALVFAVAAWP